MSLLVEGKINGARDTDCKISSDGISLDAK